MLDTLRAIAILMVLMRHAVHYDKQSPIGVFWNIWYNGWLGVDLFFALSGFLITHHLMCNWPKHNAKHYIYKYFRKRALRILPLYIVIIIIAGFSIVPYFKPDYTVSYLSVFVHAIFMQDYVYFTSILVPLWSLGVEEKFYLVAPILVYLFIKFKTTNIVGVGTIVILSILITRGWLLMKAPSLSYAEFFWQYRAPFHFSVAGILTGSLVAVVHSQLKDKNLDINKLRLLGYASLIILVVILTIDRWLESENWLMTNVIIFLSSICFAILIFCGIAAKPNADTKIHKMLRFIAKLAFPLYLVHLMLLPMAKVIAASISASIPVSGFGIFLIIYIGLSFIGAAILHLAIEKPFLNIKDRL